MSHAAKLARDEAITEALRAANDALGNQEPSPQAFAIFAAIKALRDPKPIRAPAGGADYLAKVQAEARKGYVEGDPIGPENNYSAGITTPLGRLFCTTWRTIWAGKRGERVVWSSEYMLNDMPISIREIRDAGLAQKPTTRKRRPKS